MGLQLLDLPGWPENVVAGYTTREGGCSQGAYESFNLAAHVGDEVTPVAANRRRLLESWPADVNVQWLQQVHGIDVVRAAGGDSAPEADACWSDREGMGCAVLVADCLPVLLCSRDGRYVAAAHAGWRGLAAGVIEATVASLPCDADQLLAWLGPCIGTCHFRVGRDVAAQLSEGQPAQVSDFFRDADDPDFCFADLQSLARLRLERLGVAEIAATTSCTYCQEGRFFSYRRDGESGRFAALIARK